MKTMRPKPLRDLTVLLAAAIFVPPASAAVLSYAGTHTNLGSGWRTSAVAKPLDADADRVLGTDGYHLVNRPPVLPAYVSQTTILTSTYPGNGGYALMDDPVAMPGVFITGTMNPHPGPGVSADLFRFTLNTNAVGRTIRVGLLVDNLDIASFNASSLSLVQTNSPGATSGPVATGSAAFNDRIPDWVFFDIAGAAAGDTFIVRGVGGASSTAALGGVSFDSLGTVINTADSGPGSLRAVVAASSPGATITFATNLSGQTITLTSEVPLDKSLVLDASALPGGVTISGNGTGRLLNIGPGGNVTLVGLTFMGGGWVYSGGAIYTAGGSALRISRCTFFGNTALEGGAILNDGSLVVENSTFSGNSGGYGGALQCRYLASLVHCTFSSNSASYGGAIYNKWSTLTINNSIIAGNTAGGGGGDILSESAALVLTNANLIQDAVQDASSPPTAGPAPLTNAPLLAALGAYGGPAQTMPPLIGSPAIDAAGVGVLPTDQRGLPRVIGPAADLGAVEFFVTNAVVTTNVDSGIGSLRFAVDHGSPAASNSVTFAANLAAQTIQLTRGQLYLNKSFSVDASALSSPVKINANSTSRILYVETNAVVVLNSLVLSNGLAAGVNGTNGATSGDRGGDGTAAFGGGIYNAGNLTLNQTTLGGCVALGGNGGRGIFTAPGTSAPGYGGGIYNLGTLTLNQSALISNSVTGGAGGLGVAYPGRVGSPGLGGGIYNAGTVTLNDTTVTGGSANGGAGGSTQSGAPGGNAGAGQGGAIFSTGALTLNRSTIAGTAANGGAGGNGTGSPSGLSARAGGQGAGGALYNLGTLAINQSTIANTTAAGGAGGLDFNFAFPGTGGDGFGGAIYNAASLALNQDTVSGGTAIAGANGNGLTNAASEGGGIYGASAFSLFNSIVAGNSALTGSNLVGSVTLTGTNVTTGDPLLSPLGYYGGLTPTLRPLAGSRAIDAGSDAATNAPYNFATDQRGQPRRSGLRVDIGAAELQFGVPTITALGATVTGSNPANGAFTVQLAVSVNPNGEATAGVYFQYGLTAAYAGTNGPTNVPMMVAPYQATNLSVAIPFNSGFTYHWNARAANSLFSASTPDQTFHLAPPGLPGDTNGDGVVSQSELDAVYASYLPTSPWLALTNVAGLGGTNVTFALEGSPLGAYTVEYSTNLADWLPLGPATPRYGFTDTNAPALPQRHYRLRYP